MEVEAVGRVNFTFFPHYIQQEKITKERILMNNNNNNKMRHIQEENPIQRCHTGN